MNLPERKKTYGMATVILVVMMIASCGTPDQRTYEDGWNVLRNQCGDVSSTIRIKEQFEMSISRQLTLHDQKNQDIYALNVVARRGRVDVQSTTYANDLSNRELETKVIKSSEINNDANTAIDTYYGQPDKHKELDFGCLFKGLKSS